MGLSPLPARSSQRPARRGVLLLVILALLAMFGMVAVTFVVVASQARLAAEAHQRLDETTDPPRKLLNAGLMQVLRGSTNPASAIGPHSLLEDVYGNRSERHTASGAAPAASGELITVTVSMPISNARGRIGGVLTVVPDTTGMTAMVGRSARILNAVESGSNSVLTLLPFEGVSVSDALGVLTGNFPVIISGAPFSGTGFAAGLALTPGDVNTTASAAANTDVGANEDYDAADFQNMILAAQIPDGTTGQVDTIPSLHRPALVNYHGGAADESYVLRPLHSTFDGGNSSFHPVNGPWDVDNDGDGVPDSIWVDLGMPARAAPDGQLYKPLFAILCVDMDGKLNVNAHGALPQTVDEYYDNPPLSDQEYADPNVSLPFRGQGYGPAEVNLAVLFNGDRDHYRQLLTGNGTTWSGRYGANGMPGATAIDALCEARWFDYDYTNGFWPDGTKNYGTPPDLFGTVAVGLDSAGRPIWDQTFSGQPGTNNPYESNPMRRVARGPLTGDDQAFSPAELERILRCYDRDTLTLPPRLYELLQLGGVDVRYLRHDMTTDSVDVPVPGGRFLDLLSARSVPEAHWRDLFDPDLLAGRKMNLNRPLPQRGESMYLEARQFLARHLYCLAFLLGEPADDLAKRQLAQWAVNAVDFLDSDFIMTPFEFVSDPFAATVTWRTGMPDGDTEPGKLVWGMEQPVLCLTETIAFHDRRVADTSLDQTGKKRTDKEDAPSGSEYPYVPADDDLDQALIPQGSLFVELYCASEPVVRSTDLFRKRMNPATNSEEWALNMGKKAGSDSPVWRLAITTTNVSARIGAGAGPESLETDGSGATIDVERVIAFARGVTYEYDPGNIPPPVYSNRNGSDIYLFPGEYLVVGPRETTEVGTGSPQKITLPVVNIQGTKKDLPGTIKTPQGMIAAANLGESGDVVGVSVSEPLPDEYYPAPEESDGSYNPPQDKPLDSQAGKPLFEESSLATNTYQGFRYILLQRLADPTKPYEPDPTSATREYNPYRTVDWLPIDLTVFNGEDEKPEVWVPKEPDGKDSFDPDTPWDPDDPNPDAATIQFDTRERGTDGSPQNLWNQREYTSPENTSAGGVSARFSHALVHTLGYLNSTFGTPKDSGIYRYKGDPTVKPFPWVTWNNRPMATPHELMMVPTTSASQFGLEFAMNDGAFAHLVYYFDSSATGTASKLCRLFDYVDVPSRVAGAHAYVSGVPAPANFVPQYANAGDRTTLIPFDAAFVIGPNLVPTYREPGKINLNTIYSENVFRGLMNGFDGLWQQFLLSRRGYGAAVNPLIIDTGDPALPTRFARPFRGSASALLFPPDASPTLPASTADRSIESTLLRSKPDGSSPLFAFTAGGANNDPDRNPYFRYQGLMRLANLTTTRSNVYAVWITVGYFEAMPTSDTSIAGGYQLGRELGVETGEIKRHRAFYMIDRSIPVGFVRGEDMNVESTIMLQRYIE